MRIGYRRVSSEEQNLDRQELAGCDKVFEEKASAGRGSSRPQLDALLEFAREGDEVVVHSIDRLARDLRDLQALLEALNTKGVSVSFLSERLMFSASQDDPFSQLQLQLLGAFSQFERSIIRKRQAEGIAKAKAKGVYRGRQPSIDPEQVKQLKRSGLGATAIAQQLGIGRASVYRLLEG
ncbi:MAG: transposase [Candidatus Aquiluna sp. XM-24bin5]|jgi:DNA invertase Pin-like site-specific DNA recombinase|nr:MAG: transposase [Candidatus Aquiluna sp. XM-24bin5]